MRNPLVRLALVIVGWPLLAATIGIGSYLSITSEAIDPDLEKTRSFSELTSPEKTALPDDAIRKDAIESAIAIGFSVATGIYLLIGLRAAARKIAENQNSVLFAC